MPLINPPIRLTLKSRCSRLSCVVSTPHFHQTLVFYRNTFITSCGLSRIRSQTGSKKSPILSRIPLPTSHENIYTVPNILTMTRLVAAPLVGYFLVHDYHQAALALFAYAGITDLVDGYIARRYNLQTVVGTIIDPMADKLLMTIGVACLAVNGSIPGKQSTNHYVGEMPTRTAMLTCSNSVARRHHSRP